MTFPALGSLPQIRDSSPRRSISARISCKVRTPHFVIRGQLQALLPMPHHLQSIQSTTFTTQADIVLTEPSHPLILYHGIALPPLSSILLITIGQRYPRLHPRSPHSRRRHNRLRPYGLCTFSSCGLYRWCSRVSPRYPHPV